MRFLDSNILAYAFYDNDHREICQEFIREGGVINALNLVESFNIIHQETGDADRACQAIKSFLKSKIQVIPVDANLVFETLKNISPRLRFIDNLHFTTAKLHSCTEIASFDKDFDGLDIPRVA